MDILLNKLWRINIIFCAGIAITTIYELADITSLLFYCSFVITAVCMWLCLKKPVTKYTRNTLIFLIYLILFGLISVVQGGIGFAYLKKFIIYITTLCSFYVVLKIQPNRRTVNLLLGSNVVMSILYIIRSRADGAYVQEMLWLFFSNPNFAGMWLFMSMSLLVATLFFVKKRFWQIILLALAGQLAYLCFQTDSRNILLAIGYMVLLCVVCLISKVPQFKKWMLFAADLYPLLFALAYMYLVANDLVSEGINEALVSEGKPITSRFAIWEEAFTYIGQRPLLGAYSIVQGGSGSFQLHNTHIDMWAAYGTVGFVLFLIYIYRILKEANDSCNTKGAMVALAGFICMTLMGSAEASLYSTGMGMYIFISSFLLLSNYLNQNRIHEDHLSIN